MRAAGIEIPESVTESVEKCLKTFFPTSFKFGHVKAHFREFIQRDFEKFKAEDRENLQTCDEMDKLCDRASDNWLRIQKEKGRIRLASGNWTFVETPIPDTSITVDVGPR